MEVPLEVLEVLRVLQVLQPVQERDWEKEYHRTNNLPQLTESPLLVVVGEGVSYRFYG